MAAAAKNYALSRALQKNDLLEMVFRQFNALN
jgi:hypothetical protein